MPHQNVSIKDNPRYKIVEKLLWIDLEMTGLDVEKEKIIEIAAVVTDLNFEILGKLDLVIQQSESILKKMHPWCQETFTSNGLLKKVQKSKIDLETAEKKLLKFIDKYFEKDIPIILAGSSIHFDRKFILKCLQNLENRLHYRMLDVTSFKILFSKKYNKSLETKNGAAHLAMSDILHSIEELKFYTKFIKKR